MFFFFLKKTNTFFFMPLPDLREIVVQEEQNNIIYIIVNNASYCCLLILYYVMLVCRWSEIIKHGITAILCLAYCDKRHKSKMWRFGSANAKDQKPIVNTLATAYMALEARNIMVMRGTRLSWNHLQLFFSFR